METNMLLGAEEVKQQNEETHLTQQDIRSLQETQNLFQSSLFRIAVSKLLQRMCELENIFIKQQY